MAAGILQLVVGGFFAGGIFLLLDRRRWARGFWLVVLCGISSLCVCAATLVSTDQRNLFLASALWLAVWALYFARSQRLRAALEDVIEYDASAV
jgi:hypothetical protein